MRFTLGPLVVAAVGVTLIPLHPALAIEVIFSISSSTSSVSLSASSSGVNSISAQSPGSDITTAVGNFTVDIDDPVNPTSIAFESGIGYANLQNTGGGITFQPLAPSPQSSAANLALQGTGGAYGPVQLAARNTVWDFGSPAIAVSNGTFSAADITVDVRSGRYDIYAPNVFSVFGPLLGLTTDANQTFDFSGQNYSPSAATGALTELNGQLSLSLGGTLPAISYGPLLTATYAATLTATANFGPNNLATAVIDGNGLSASVLGGTSSVGGVSAVFGSGTEVGTFAAQQIPLAGLPAASVSGLQALASRRSPKRLKRGK